MIRCDAMRIVRNIEKADEYFLGGKDGGSSWAKLGRYLDAKSAGEMRSEKRELRDALFPRLLRFPH